MTRLRCQFWLQINKMSWTRTSLVIRLSYLPNQLLPLFNNHLSSNSSWSRDLLSSAVGICHDPSRRSNAYILRISTHMDNDKIGIGLTTIQGAASPRTMRCFRRRRHLGSLLLRARFTFHSIMTSSLLLRPLCHRPERLARDKSLSAISPCDNHIDRSS